MAVENKNNQADTNQANTDIASDTNKTSEDNLQKALDESLKGVQDLLKSKKNEDELEEKMKDPKEREKMKKLMKKYEEDEDDDEDDEEEDEGKSKMKKSLDSFVEENQEIFDAVPILKSFVNILDNLMDSVHDLNKKIDEGNTMQKSIAEVVVSESTLLKSFAEELEKIGNTPLPKKGVISKDQILNKSFGETSGTQTQINPMAVKNILLKSANEKEIPAGEVTRYELSRYNFGSLHPKTQQLVMSKLNIGGDK